MSNSTTLQVLLKAVDLASRPFKAIQSASLSLSGNIDNTRQKLNALNVQAAQIDGYRATESGLSQTGKALAAAKVNTQQLAIAFKGSAQPTHVQVQELASARENVNRLKQQQTGLRLTLQQQRLGMLASGTSAQALTANDNQLRISITQTTERLNQQQKRLEQVRDWKQKVSSVKEGFQRRKGYADQVSSIGASGLAFANKIIAPRAAAAQQQEEAHQSQSAVQPQPLFTAPNMGSLSSDLAKLTAAKNKLSVDWFAPQAESQRLLIQTATDYLQKLDGWVQKNGELVQTFGTIAAVAAGVAGVIGAIGSVVGPVLSGINMVMTATSLLGPVFQSVAIAIGALSWPVVAVVAVVAGAALLIRKFWEPLSAFFGGLFGGVFETVQTTFSGIGEILQTVWQKFSALADPIRASEKTLNSCRDAGVLFGKLLAEALLWPINQFRQLVSLGDSVLEFLHLKEKTPQLSAPQAAPAIAAEGYIPETSSLPGYQNESWGYPVVNGGSKNFTDNRVNNVSVTMMVDPNSAVPTEMQLRNYLDQALRDNATQSRSMNYYSR